MLTSAVLQGAAAAAMDMSGVSDGADDMSCDGSAAPASVRDAALRALQSSDSVRRRLVRTESKSDEISDDAASGAPACRTAHGNLPETAIPRRI